MIAEPHELQKLCYGIAYFLIPQLLFSEPERLIGKFTHPEYPPGQWLYAVGCSVHKITGTREIAEQFHTHVGTLHEGTVYYVLEYPWPPPFSLDNHGQPLSPFFSAILHTPATNGVQYYVLGQGPVGGTTLRSVSSDGANANLGPGPEPTLDNFLNALKPRNA